MSIVGLKQYMSAPAAPAISNLSIVDLHILYAKKIMDCGYNEDKTVLFDRKLIDGIANIAAELRKRNHDAPVLGAPLNTIPVIRI